MEGKIANWVDLGIMPYSETMQIQDRLVEMRKRDLIPDTILSVQHPVTVSFGADQANNLFSEALLQKVLTDYGLNDYSSVLAYLGKKGVDFHKSSRGGGATVFAPGQFVFYPIVDHQKITGFELDVGKYKDKIYGALFGSLQGLGVDGLNVGSQESFRTRDERKDIWIVRNGVVYKMGSKGLQFNGNVAYQGFALNVDEEGISKSWMVNQCGYNPSEVKLWSVEQELGRKVPAVDVYDSVQKALSKNFGYTHFRTTALTKKEPVELSWQ